MTVSSDIARHDYLGNGVLITYPFTFEVYTRTDIKVYVSGVLKTVDVHYTVPVAGINNPAGGNVVFTSGNIPALAVPIAIILDLPLTQLVDYVEGDKFPAETHEKALDRSIKIDQALKNKISHVAKLPDYSTIDLIMPTPVSNNVIGWNSTADQLENKTNLPVVVPGSQYEIDALISYGSGTAYTKATIDAALTAIGTSSKVTLLLRPGAWTITADADYSAYGNVNWKIPNGTTFVLTAGKILTIPGPSNIIAAPNQQIFSGAGTVIFAKEGTAYPEWWGTNTTPGTTDMLASIQYAIDSFATAGGGEVSFLGGIHKITGSIICKRAVDLTAINQESTAIYAPGAITAIVIDYVAGSYDSAYLTIKGFQIYGDETAGGIGVRIGGTALVGYDIFDKCYIHHFETGVSMRSGIFINFMRCMIQYNTVGVEWKTAGLLYNTTVSFEYCTIHDNTREGFKRTSKGSYNDIVLNMIGCCVQANGDPVAGTTGGWYQLDISSWRAVELNALYMEHSGVLLSGVTRFPYAIVANDCNNVVINGGMINGSYAGFATSNIDGLVINGLQTRNTMWFGVYIDNSADCTNIILQGCSFDKAPNALGKNRMDVHSNYIWLQPNGYGTFGVGVSDPNIREIIAWEVSGDFASIDANSSLDSADISKVGINAKTAMFITPITTPNDGLIFYCIPLSAAGAVDYYRIRAVNVTAGAINPGSITWRIVAFVMDT